MGSQVGQIRFGFSCVRYCSIAVALGACGGLWSRLGLGEVRIVQVPRQVGRDKPAKKRSWPMASPKGPESPDSTTKAMTARGHVQKLPCRCCAVWPLRISGLLGCPELRVGHSSQAPPASHMLKSHYLAQQYRFQTSTPTLARPCQTIQRTEAS